MGCGSSAAAGEKYQAGADGGKPAKGGGDKDKNQHKQDNAQYMETMKFLMGVPLLKKLPASTHPILASAVDHCDFAQGAVIFKQGEEGKEFYVIKEGSASVSVLKDGESAPTQVATLKSGDYFGEGALLSNETRGATVTAGSAMKCLKITKQKFQELNLQDQLQFVNRKAVGAGGGGRTMETKAPSPKTAEEAVLIKKALRSNVNLQTMAALDETQVQALVDVAWKEDVAKGCEIIKEGDIVADYFYICQAGSFEVRLNEDQGGSSAVSRIDPQGSFGELALLYLVPRAATVVAREPSTVWVIDRGNFKKIIMRTTAAKLNEYVTLLNAVEVLQPLLAEEKQMVAQALVEMHFVEEEVILRQGDPGSTFYILYEGQVTVWKDDKEVARLAATGSSDPKIFGERALLQHEPRAATVVVSSATAKILALDKDSFEMLLGPLADIIAAAESGAGRSVAQGKGGQTKGATLNHKISRDHLKKIGLLGCGGFGAVELWEHKETKETYAMKVISKGFVVKTGMQESIMNEKNILLMTDSPFVIKLHATYNGTQMVYFLLEPALGGELYATYARKGFHGSEKHARYYIAGTVFAFEHCHERKIVYRDLKPENLLFNEKGHLKLTDMGLAKFVIGKTFTTCGTPDYFAPELITSAGHTNAVDWWTLGILLFELLTGHPPFESAFPMQIYSKVLKGIGKVQMPSSVPAPAEALIKALLRKEPSERLPCLPGGTERVKTHNWYKKAQFDWNAMFTLALPPPYVPVVRSKTDIANFSARKEDMPRMIEYQPDGSNWDEGFATSN